MENVTRRLSDLEHAVRRWKTLSFFTASIGALLLVSSGTVNLCLLTQIPSRADFDAVRAQEREARREAQAAREQARKAVTAAERVVQEMRELNQDLEHRSREKLDKTRQ